MAICPTILKSKMGPRGPKSNSGSTSASLQPNQCHSVAPHTSGARRYTRRTNVVAAHLTLPFLRASANPAMLARCFDLAASMERCVMKHVYLYHMDCWARRKRLASVVHGHAGVLEYVVRARRKPPGGGYASTTPMPSRVFSLELATADAVNGSCAYQ